MAADEEWAVQSKNSTRRAYILAKNWKQFLVVFYYFGVNHFQNTSSLNVHCVEKFADYKKFQGGTWEELQQGSKVKKHFIVKIVLVQENKFCAKVWICWFSWFHSPQFILKNC
jgi:hypothetical protein